MSIAGIPSKEELVLIRDSVLLPMLLSVAENKSRKKEWKADFAERVMDLITADIKRVKAKLKAAHIRVVEEGRAGDPWGALHYRYICRGYEDTFPLMKFVVKAELGVKLRTYAYLAGRHTH